MVEETRIVLRNYGLIDPDRIEDYLARGGYGALAKAVHFNPKVVLQEVKDSGLRGRGGAGFNAGVKWGFTFQAQADQKYIVCNADEGEPGTYKDRLILEGDPHSVLEGMAIAGYAVGASKGFIYCRGEYPYIVERLQTAINQAKQNGNLGNNLFGSGFDFNIEIRVGAGAYVCGEETALIESIEGKRGEPRFKPPFPGVVGLWGKPTVVNNVETLANIPVIIERGAKWFKAIGAEKYPGTKVFTLTGDVAHKIFCEVATNTTIKDIIFGLGGNIANGCELKAVQIGGTSGAFIPEMLLDTPVDLDSMATAGATLGSGAVFVLNKTRDIVDIVTCISKFFKHESCGHCTPCREGTFRSYELMHKINIGEGTQLDLDSLELLIDVMQRTALCGLGQAAPVPIVTTLRHFRNEYNAKLRKQV
jgi:NADH:ubiquinone oxidoreductase subunit F (NADH-binding)